MSIEALKTSHTALDVALATSPAAMQKRLWSSTPVTILSSVPSSSMTPDMTSICHSCIARSRWLRPKKHRIGILHRFAKVRVASSSLVARS